MKLAKEIQPGDKVQLADGTWAKVKTNTNGMISGHRMFTLNIPEPDWVHVSSGSEIEVG